MKPRCKDILEAHEIFAKFTGDKVRLKMLGKEAVSEMSASLKRSVGLMILQSVLHEATCQTSSQVKSQESRLNSTHVVSIDYP